MGRGYAAAAVDVNPEVEPDKPNASTGVRAYYRQNHPAPDEFFDWKLYLDHADVVFGDNSP